MLGLLRLGGHPLQLILSLEHAGPSGRIPDAHDPTSFGHGSIHSGIRRLNATEERFDPSRAGTFDVNPVEKATRHRSIRRDPIEGQDDETTPALPLRRKPRQGAVEGRMVRHNERRRERSQKGFHRDGRCLVSLDEVRDHTENALVVPIEHSAYHRLHPFPALFEAL